MTGPEQRLVAPERSPVATVRMRGKEPVMDSARRLVANRGGI
jgi:hypothetical protein